MTKKLKAKHEVFCREFLVDLNATQAAIRAGYVSGRAHVTGLNYTVNLRYAPVLTS